MVFTIIFFFIAFIASLYAVGFFIVHGLMSIAYAIQDGKPVARRIDTLTHYFYVGVENFPSQWETAMSNEIESIEEGIGRLNFGKIKSISAKADPDHPGWGMLVVEWYKLN